MSLDLVFVESAQDFESSLDAKNAIISMGLSASVLHVHR